MWQIAFTQQQDEDRRNGQDQGTWVDRQWQHKVPTDFGDARLGQWCVYPQRGVDLAYPDDEGDSACEPRNDRRWYEYDLSSKAQDSHHHQEYSTQHGSTIDTQDAVAMQNNQQPG